MIVSQNNQKLQKIKYLGSSAKDAIKKAEDYINDGYRWVVDMDLEKFFDKVNHDILMYKLSKNIKDKRVLSLIRKYNF